MGNGVDLYNNLGRVIFLPHPKLLSQICRFSLIENFRDGPTYDGECGLPRRPDADDVLGHALVPPLVRRGAHVAHSQAAVGGWGESEIKAEGIYAASNK